MPKKKIVEEVSQEAAEQFAAEELTPQTENPAAGREREVMEDLAPPKQLDVEEPAVSKEESERRESEQILELVPEEAPEIIAVSLEERSESSQVENDEDMSDTFGSATDMDIPYGEDVPERSEEKSDADERFGVEESEANLQKIGTRLTLASAEKTAGESAIEPNERTPEDERRAFYGLDFNELDRELTPEQRQEWNSVYASYRGHNVMSGTVIGVDRHRLRVKDRRTGEMTWHQLYCAIVIPFRVRILIPETEMWQRGEERPGYVLRNLPGAKIDFVIIHVDRKAGFAVGSRRLALSSRRYYFSVRPGLNARGSRANCEVLVVGPRRCLVSCHGFDLDLTQRELSYTAMPDLRDVYHSGQTLDCIVKEYDREEGRLSVSVKETAPNPFDGAEFRHPAQSHRLAVISGKYGGGVFCNLSDGVTVMCNYSFHYDDSVFRIGDRVMLIIQRYDDSKKQIYGKIVAKC